MSITLKLALLDGSLAQRLIADPRLARQVEIDPSRDPFLRKHGIEIERTIDVGPEEVLSLDKDWDLLNYLFEDRSWRSFLWSSWPSSFLTEGGRPIGTGNGYGPARLFDASEVAVIDDFLTAFDLSGALNALTEREINKANLYSFSNTGIPVEETRRIARIWVEELRGFMRRGSTSSSSVYAFLI